MKKKKVSPVRVANSRMGLIIFAIVIGQAAHAGFFVFSRMAMIGKGAIKPDVFTWFRYMLSVPVLHLLLWLKEGQRPLSSPPKAEHLGKFIVTGFLHVYFGQYLLFISVQMLPALETSLLSSISPAFVFVIGVALGVEPLVKKRGAAFCKITGLLFALAGAITYTLLNVASSHTAHYDYVKGMIFILVSLTGGAFYHVMLKVILNFDYSAVYCTAWAATFGLMVITAIVAPALTIDTFKLSPTQIGVILYDALMPSCVLQVLSAFVVRETSATFAAAFGPLGVIFTAFLSWPFLGEVPTVAVYCAAPIIILGLFLLILGRHREVEIEVEDALEAEAAQGQNDEDEDSV
jgi:drug/metabolite transporter (DMT)-like permease